MKKAQNQTEFIEFQTINGNRYYFNRNFIKIIRLIDPTLKHYKITFSTNMGFDSVTVTDYNIDKLIGPQNG